MLIFDEEIFVGAICSERYSCYTQARKSSSEPIETCKGSCISPLFPKRIIESAKVNRGKVFGALGRTISPMGPSSAGLTMLRACGYQSP